MRLIVSDHALIRYMERVHGMDLEPFREQVREIIGDAPKSRTRVVNHEGFMLTLEYHPREAVVITVLPNGARLKSPQEAQP